MSERSRVQKTTNGWLKSLTENSAAIPEILLRFGAYSSNGIDTSDTVFADPRAKNVNLDPKMHAFRLAASR